MSIFRYPGGKSKAQALQKIKAYFPEAYSEYREPFVGGGGVFWSIDPSISRWINDINRPLIAVYEALKGRPRQFIESCESIAPASLQEETVHSQTGIPYPKRLVNLFHSYLYDDTSDPALRYYFLNRCAWNGRVILDPNRRNRASFSNPRGWSVAIPSKLARAAEIVAAAKITCSSFELLFNEPGKDVLIFADPPYVVDTNFAANAKLYEFSFSHDDHRRLRDCVLRSQHKIVMTYDDHPTIRELYRELYIHEASWTYWGRKDRAKGRELIITNYPVMKTARNAVSCSFETVAS